MNKYFTRDVNLRIRNFLVHTDFSRFNSNNELTSELESYLVRNGYEVVRDFELSSLTRLKLNSHSSTKSVDLMVKDARLNEFYPIEFKFYMGRSMTPMRRRMLRDSFATIQSLINSYRVIEGGATICVTNNAYITGDAKTSVKMGLSRRHGNQYLQIPTKRVKPKVESQAKDLEWKATRNNPSLKYAALNQKQIQEPVDDTLQNVDELICDWHVQYKKSKNGEHIDF